jgi:hypothetical protein
MEGDPMFPSIPRRRAALAVLAAAAAIPAFATSAQATIGPGTPTTSTPLGQVTLETVWAGFVGPADSKGKSFSLNPGDAEFTWYQGKVGAHLTGMMHAVGAVHTQARVRVVSLTANNGVIGTTYDAKAGTQINSGSQDVPVDVTVPAAPDLAKIEIVLEEKSNTPNWDDRGEFYAQFVPRTDDVTLLGKHLDLGGSSSSGGAPTTPATVGWAVNPDGTLKATYRGYLHFSGAAASGRVELRQIDPLTGLVDDTVDGKTWSFDGNGPQTFPSGNVPETITVTPSTPTLEVVSQSWVPTPTGGYWADIDSQRVSAGDSDN